jgi:hypothetical protein
VPVEVKQEIEGVDEPEQQTGDEAAAPPAAAAAAADPVVDALKQEAAEDGDLTPMQADGGSDAEDLYHGL